MRTSPRPESPAARGTPWIVRIVPDADVPASTQLYRQIAVAIQGGGVDPGHRLPSARLLARDLGLHYHTVNKVYLRLREEGLITMNRRKQLHVHGPRSAGSSFVTTWTDRQRGLLTEAIAGGMTPRDLLDRLRLLLRNAEVPLSGRGGGR